jgi:hypothetical protein
MSARQSDGERSERLASHLRRLERGDEVRLGTDTGTLKSPRTFTVERVAEEVEPRDDEVYYRVHLRGPRGGQYVVYPDEKPQGKGAHPTPELFYRHPGETNEWGTTKEETEGSVVYFAVEVGAPRRRA